MNSLALPGAWQHCRGHSALGLHTPWQAVPRSLMALPERSMQTCLNARPSSSLGCGLLSTSRLCLVCRRRQLSTRSPKGDILSCVVQQVIARLPSCTPRRTCKRARQRQQPRAHRARGLVLLVHRQRRDARGLHGGVGRALGAPGRIRCRAFLLDLVVPARARGPVDRRAGLRATPLRRDAAALVAAGSAVSAWACFR